MLVSEDNQLGDFCCPFMEKYTLESDPEKCIGLDPFWKKYDCDIPELRMYIYTKKGTGVASQMYGGTQQAGKGQVPVSFCPWCGTKITFS